MKKRVLEYVITTAVGLLITFLLLLSKNIFSGLEEKELYRSLTDSFFVAGILIVAAGLIVVVSDGGAFDMLVYGVYRFFTIFRSKPNEIKYKTYYDYVTAKADKEKHSFLYMILVGALFIGISMIFLYFWYQTPGTTNP